MDPLKAKANFARICQLLIEKGGDALRAAFQVIHPPSTLAAALNANRRTLQSIRYSVIKPPQWKVLFPASGSPDSKTFDITLLTILLRNICGLPSPAAGWNVMPPVGDNSMSASILRIKMYRNDVYGHISTAEYDDVTFERLWQEISAPLIKLSVLRQDIDELKEAPLSPEEVSYIEKLKEWKELEDGLLDKLNDVGRKVDDIPSKIMKLWDTAGTSTDSKVDQLAKFDFTGKIDGLCKRFHDDTRKWFFDELSRWFTDEESRVMILTAGPGVGKSVLSAKACEVFKQRDQLAAYHFCDFRNSDSTNPSRILQSLASHMCSNVDGFRDKLIEILGREHSRNSLSEEFRVLLHDPLHALDGQEPMLIVVDALDESKTDDKSEFLELISDEFPELPKWIKILISSRPELQVKKKLEHFNPVEICPDDPDHNLDLEHFFRGSLPSLNEDNITLLVEKCEGSFLYAYYLGKELEEMHLEVEANISDYAPKGISAFYEKQFKRLKTGLQRFNESILKGFVNVVAASRARLPFKILFKSLDLSDEVYEIRNAIINIMSEILPVYDDCLTIYHKSLTDWLKSDGYEEHVFVADVRDGNKRLWQACRSIYEQIDFQKSVLDIELSLERKYALQNGGNYLVLIGETEDFCWLVHVRLNALKLRFLYYLYVNFSLILRNFRSKLTDELYWNIVQHRCIQNILRGDAEAMTCSYYLQSLTNGDFDFLKNRISSRKTARDILDEIDEIWIDEVNNESDSDYTIVSNAKLPNTFDVTAISPDNKLLVYLGQGGIVAVFVLASLTMSFEVKVSQMNSYPWCVTFSPDSSYFLCSSIRSCVCIRKQKEVAFIPHGPASIRSCSFSSCGMKLATSEESFVKVWDVKKRNLLVQVNTLFRVDNCLFSSCNSYILGIGSSPSADRAIWDSTTLQVLAIENTCFDTCLTDKDNLKVISFPCLYDTDDGTQVGHIHLPTGEIVLIVSRESSAKPFTWKNRKCVVFPSSLSTLLVYDFINQEVIDKFQIDCLSSGWGINYVSKLDGTNFLVSFNFEHVMILSFATTEESSVAHASFVNSVVECCTVSPDNMYVACCYKNCTLTIRSIDSGETLQTVVLQHPPEACWWSESYLWVVCKGVVVKYSYDSTSTKVLGNDLEECNINFLSVLKFEEGVLVVYNNEGKISIFKICNKKLDSQQISDSISDVASVAISSDGCAVLLCRRSFSDYQLWEVAHENRWELHSTGSLGISDVVGIGWFCVTGRRNCRSSIWITHHGSRYNMRSRLSVIDFSIGKLYEREIMRGDMKKVAFCFRPNLLVICTYVVLYLINLSDGKTIKELVTGRIMGELRHASYLSSKGIFRFVFDNDIKCFKIPNIENCLEL